METTQQVDSGQYLRDRRRRSAEACPAQSSYPFADMTCLLGFTPNASLPTLEIPEIWTSGDDHWRAVHHCLKR